MQTLWVLVPLPCRRGEAEGREEVNKYKPDYKSPRVMIEWVCATRSFTFLVGFEKYEIMYRIWLGVWVVTIFKREQRHG